MERLLKKDYINQYNQYLKKYKMTSKELSVKTTTIIHKIKTEEDGFEYFKKEWLKISDNDKIYLKQGLIKWFYDDIKNPNTSYTVYYDYVKILEYLDSNYIENMEIENSFPLKTNEDFNDKELTKIFWLLRKKRIITDSVERTASAIELLFGIKYGTAKSYLRDTTDMEIVRNILN